MTYGFMFKDGNMLECFVCLNIGTPAYRNDLYIPEH